MWQIHLNTGDVKMVRPSSHPKRVRTSNKLIDTYKMMIKFDDCPNVGTQLIQLKLMERETFLGTQKRITDEKQEWSLRE